MKPIGTQRLVIRNWQEEDRPLFHVINADEEVMRFFPMRRTRAESDALMDRIRDDNERKGYGFAALEMKHDGACIGFAGLQDIRDIVPARPGGAVEIGWRLAPSWWGNGYASEAAQALLRFGFADLGLDEIIAFAVWNNDRSTAVMRRLGMEQVEGGDFDHPRVPDSHPHLRRHVLYRLTRADWLARGNSS